LNVTTAFCTAGVRQGMLSVEKAGSGEKIDAFNNVWAEFAGSSRGAINMLINTSERIDHE